MKYRLAFIFVIALTLAALVWSEKRKVDAPVRADPVLYFIADAESELSRLPMAATRLSDRQEIQAGDQLARRASVAFAYRGDLREADPEAVEPYLAAVGRRVAAHAHRPLPYRFHYIPRSSFVNAFALPGGHVFVGAGLIELMDTEDELAAVLGHEIEHIDHYHCAERVQVEVRLRRLPLGALVELPLQVFEAGYSKEQELEADREGTRLAVAASYSPLGARRLFETFDRLYREYTARARSPQAELAEVTIGALEGYFRSHPPASERIEQINKMITDEHWGNLTSERPLEVAYLFSTAHAVRAYYAGHYQQAVELAQRSLAAQPYQPVAKEVLGSSEFALADFSQAAAAYRALLDSSLLNEDFLRAYTDSLAARGDPAAALREYQVWQLDHALPFAVPARSVELAGLRLAARDMAGAKTAVAEVNQAPSGAWPPELEGRYGWWNYRTGDYSAALRLLTRAVEQRPTDATFTSHLGWVLIEQRNFEGALARFTAPRRNFPGRAARLDKNLAPRLSAEPNMGAAVAYWLAGQPEEALRQFSLAANTQPEWLNPRWTRALYSQTVAKAVADLQAEQQKRRAAAERTSARPGIHYP